MNGFGPPEGDYDCCPRCTMGYTCPDCQPKGVRVVPLEDVDLSKHGESLVRLFLEISTSDELSERQKRAMLGALLKGG